MGNPADQPTPAPSTQDALQLVAADHRTVRALLADLRLLSDEGSAAADVQGLLARLAALLRVHGTIEHELLYPALAGRAEASRLARADEEHAAIEALLAALAGDARSAPFAARLETLVAAVEGHLDAEELHLLPHAAGLDLAALGTAMALRRGALQADSAPD